MKRRSIAILIYMLFSVVFCAPQAHASDPVLARGQIRVVTALDHLTVLEFDEAVTQVALGSSAFQVERQENKVFIKPLKPGAATNLFVWTASKQSFDYELTVGEVSNMNAEIRTATFKPVPPADPAPMEQVADHLIRLALLGRESIDNRTLSATPNKINLRVEGLFRGKKTTYVHYSVENLTLRPYRLIQPVVYQLQAENSRVSLIPLRNTQLNRTLTKELGKVTELPLPVAHTDGQIEDVAPGERKQGIIAIQNALENSSPVVCRLVLDPRTDATVVF